MQNEEARDVVVVDAFEWTVSEAALATAYPEGLGAGARAHVAQFGADGDWGPEAVVALGV